MNRHTSYLLAAATASFALCGHVRATVETESRMTIRAIQAPHDDGTAYGDSMECVDALAYAHDQGQLWIGHAGGRYLFAGLRFRDLDVARGARIKSATLHVDVAAVYEGGTISRFFGDDVDDAEDYADGKAYPQCITRTSASAMFRGDSAGKYSIDVTAIVQAIVRRDGWRAGNAMRFAGFPSDDAFEEAFALREFGEAAASVLMIEWEAAGDSFGHMMEAERLSSEPADLVADILMRWGGVCPGCAADLNGDGIIRYDDLFAALSMLDRAH